MKRLIINADDFGFDDETVDWTIKGFECGALTSATIMAGMPATELAVAYAKLHPEFSFGVHFYLVDEKPICAVEDIPSMVNPKTGKLWATRQFILRNFAGLIKVDDLVREMKAQYQAIASTGLKISHVDGHGHNHRLPQSIKAMERLQTELGILHLRVRRCQDIPVGKMGPLGRMINGPMQKRLANAGFHMTDHFAMNAGHSSDAKWFSDLLVNLPEGLTEVGVHPGVDEEWRRIDTEDCFSAHDWSGIERLTFHCL